MTENHKVFPLNALPYMVKHSYLPHVNAFDNKVLNSIFFVLKAFIVAIYTYTNV